MSFNTVWIAQWRSLFVQHLDENPEKQNEVYQEKIFSIEYADHKVLDQGPVVQSIVSLTSSFVVKTLTVLVSTISNSQVF